MRGLNAVWMLNCIVIKSIAFFCLAIVYFPDSYAQTPADHPANLSSVETLIERSRQQKNASSALAFAEKAVYLADSLGNYHLKADALHQSGIAWKFLGDQLKSATRLMEAIEMYKALRLHNKLHKAKIDLGETYRATRTYHLSLDNLYTSLSFFKMQADSVVMAEIYNRLTATYYEMLFTHPDYVKLSEKGYENENIFIEGFAGFPEIESYLSKSIHYLDTSNYIANSLRLNGLIISNMNIQASLYNVTNDPLRALELFNEIIDIIHNTGVNELLPLVYINKARILGRYRMNKPMEAIKMAHEALELAKAQDINIYVFMAYEVLHDNYFAIGDYKNAYFSMNATRNLLEQFNHEKLEILTQTQFLEYQIKQRELELQARRNQIALMVASIIAILFAFSVFFIILSGKNRKQRYLLAELQQKNQIITGQNEKLLTANAEKDKLFSIIAHDLKAPFQSILGISEMLKDDSETLDSIETQKLAGLVHTSASRTMQLLDDLLDWARLQQNRISFASEDIPVAHLMQFISELLHETAAKKNIQIVSQLPADLTMKADKEMLKTILRNLISNALKFSYPGTQVIVSAEAANGNVKISVSDSGVGIPNDKIEQLFSIGNTHIMPGTANEKGTGLGLVLCREFVEKHGGRIWVNSEVGKGAEFSFIIPS